MAVPWQLQGPRRCRWRCPWGFRACGLGWVFGILTLCCRLLIWAPGLFATCTFLECGVVSRSPCIDYRRSVPARVPIRRMHHVGDGEDDDDEAADVDLNDWAVDDCDEAVGVKMCKRMTTAMTWRRTRGGPSAASHYQHDSAYAHCPDPSKLSLKEQKVPDAAAQVPGSRAMVFLCFLRSMGFQDRGLESGCCAFFGAWGSWHCHFVCLPRPQQAPAAVPSAEERDRERLVGF